MESVRRAEPGDITQLAELAEAAFEEAGRGRGGAIWAVREARAAPMRDALSDIVDDPGWLVLVGMIDEVVLGYSVARLEQLRDASLLAVVEDLFVDPGARGVGLGEALMDEVVRWAREAGCRGIDALVLPGDRASKNFFETFGLVARAILVHRSLDPEGPRSG